MRIYLASSWRNRHQPRALYALRQAGHEVYDFRNPTADNHGFAWSQIDPEWQSWTLPAYRAGLGHPLAWNGFKLDKAALDWCEVGILLQPCGISANLELGYLIGQGKGSGVLLAEERFEPELMYLLADIIAIDLREILAWLTTIKDRTI